MFADEDYGMARVITKLYTSVHKQALFFLPQFDLKAGKYELEATADVIDKRCGHKVIFLLSKYFFASNVCQFAVSYTAAHGTGNGNLIPFHLTRDVDHVPGVLKGIAGIRWFRKGTREHTWDMLTDSLLGGTVTEDILNEIKEKIIKLVNKDSEYYLSDPPYDTDVKPAGEPIPVVEPASSLVLPPILDPLLPEVPIPKSSNGRKSILQTLIGVKRKIYGLVGFRPSSSSSTTKSHGKSNSKDPARQVNNVPEVEMLPIPVQDNKTVETGRTVYDRKQSNEDVACGQEVMHDSGASVKILYDRRSNEYEENSESPHSEINDNTISNENSVASVNTLYDRRSGDDELSIESPQSKSNVVCKQEQLDKLGNEDHGASTSVCSVTDRKDAENVIEKDDNSSKKLLTLIPTETHTDDDVNEDKTESHPLL